MLMRCKLCLQRIMISWVIPKLKIFRLSNSDDGSLDAWHWSVFNWASSAKSTMHLRLIHTILVHLTKIGVRDQPSTPIWSKIHVSKVQNSMEMAARYTWVKIWTESAEGIARNVHKRVALKSTRFWSKLGVRNLEFDCNSVSTWPVTESCCRQYLVLMKIVFRALWRCWDHSKQNYNDFWLFLKILKSL